MPLSTPVCVNRQTRCGNGSMLACQTSARCHMKSKLIHEADGQRTFAIVLSHGDEITACLTAFARQEKLSAASLKAIGALERAELAWLNWDTKKYDPIDVNEQVEVASLTGDVALGPHNQPALHIHTVLGKRDGAAVAGHLRSGVVRPTLEVILTESPRHLCKRHDPESGLALIAPDA